MVNENYFAASWDNLVKGMTASVLMLIIFLIVVFNAVLDNIPIKIGIMILYGSILFIPYLWAPQGYKVIGRMVIVKRLIGNLKIHVEGEPERWNWIWWGLRLFGSGGLYGYYGLFTFRRIGRIRMYATNRHNLVLIKDEKGRKFLLSPTKPEKFIQLLRKLT
jgi:hypothetical protein